MEPLDCVATVAETTTRISNAVCIPDSTSSGALNTTMRSVSWYASDPSANSRRTSGAHDLLQVAPGRGIRARR